MTREQLDQLARAWRRRITQREAVLVAACACAIVAVAAIWLAPVSLVLLGAVAFAAGIALRFSQAEPWKLDAVQIARHLDRAFPQFEESSALWLRPRESLTFVERLQRARIDNAAGRMVSERSASFAQPPRELLRQPVILLGVAVTVLMAVILWRAFDDTPRVSPASIDAPMPVAATGVPPALPPAWPRIESAEMIIVPPAYTGRPQRRVLGSNAEVEEGAVVAWSVKLDRDVQELALRFGANDADLLKLTPDDNGLFTAHRTVAESAVYSFTGLTVAGATWRSHDLHSLKVIKDRAPSLKILQPAIARTEIAPPATPSAPRPQAIVEVEIADDYAVAGAHLVATVAKGTGESVKFREQAIAFDRDESVEPAPTARRFRKTLDLLALGLEPGDELYFYIEAADNREPSSNRARSETRFIVLKGAEQTLSSPGTGVSGVNFIPQYFRSQRQIIIDTEKLIADQPTLSESDFRNRANNLAIDQQLLRQRYGDFLGEEADHGGKVTQAPDEHGHETHSPDDGHDHSHDAPASPPQTQTEIAAQYGHQHDSQDEATLFDRETKGTMRQALAAMWEAERFLRVAQPGEALAPENRALEIIKALQQADRSYVQRVGFEAAPIDFAARRLHGDVDDVPRSAAVGLAPAVDRQMESEIRRLLELAPWRVQRQLTPDEAELLRRVEPALIGAAIQRPDESLGAFEELRRLLAGELPQAQRESALGRALLRMLPPPNSQPKREAEISTTLAEPYFRHLESGE